MLKDSAIRSGNKAEYAQQKNYKILAHAKGGPRFPCLRTQEPEIPNPPNPTWLPNFVPFPTFVFNNLLRNASFN